MTNSSWRVGSWTTPTTTVTQPPVPSEVSPESRSKISTHIAGQFPSFIREQFPTFIDFVKEYYKSQELKGYCIDIIQNWSDYYNIDNYGDLVSTTTLISAVTTSSTTIDVQSDWSKFNHGDCPVIYLYNDHGFSRPFLIHYMYTCSPAWDRLCDHTLLNKFNMQSWCIVNRIVYFVHAPLAMYQLEQTVTLTTIY